MLSQLLYVMKIFSYLDSFILEKKTKTSRYMYDIGNAEAEISVSRVSNT